MIKHLIIIFMFLATPCYALNAVKLSDGSYLVKSGHNALYLSPAEYDQIIQEEKDAEHNRQVLAERAEQEAVKRIAELESIKQEVVDESIYLPAVDVAIY